VEINQHTKLKDIFYNFRTKNDWTLREFANKVGFLTYSYLGKIERGEVLPSRDTLKKIADRFDLSYYRLLLSAGYKVDLEKDIKTVDLGIRGKELQKFILTNSLSIYALPDLGNLITESKINPYTFCDIIGIQYSELKDLVNLDRSVSLEEALRICKFLAIKFYEGFQIVRKGVYHSFVIDDEDVAMTIHKYIEEESNVFYRIRDDEILYVKDKQYNYIASNNKLIFDDCFEEKLTQDEIEYLKECLIVYRKLNLKPLKPIP